MADSKFKLSLTIHLYDGLENQGPLDVENETVCDVIIVKDTTNLQKHSKYFERILDYEAGGKIRKLDTDEVTKNPIARIKVLGVDIELVTQVIKYFQDPIDVNNNVENIANQKFIGDFIMNPKPIYEIFDVLNIREQYTDVFDRYLLKNISKKNVIKVAKLDRFDGELQKYLDKLFDLTSPEESSSNTGGVGRSFFPESHLDLANDILVEVQHTILEGQNSNDPKIAGKSAKVRYLKEPENEGQQESSDSTYVVIEIEKKLYYVHPRHLKIVTASYNDNVKLIHDRNLEFYDGYQFEGRSGKLLSINKQTCIVQFFETDFEAMATRCVPIKSLGVLAE